MSFDSKTQARSYIRELAVTLKFRSKKNTKFGVSKKRTAYECPNCGQWHITTGTELKGKRLKSRQSHLRKFGSE